MLLGSIILTLLQANLTLPIILQMIDYILLVVNAIYTLVFTVFVVPTYKEHKALVKDYNDRSAPANIELKNIDKNKVSAMEAKLNKMETDISELNHTVKNMSNQLQVALKRKEDEPDWEDFIKIVNKLNEKL